MIGRTSAYALATTCSGAGQPGSRPAISVAGEHLLGLGVRTVGDERHAPLRAQTSSVHRRGQRSGLHELSGVGQLGVEGLHKGAHRRKVLRRPRLPVAGLTGHAVVVML